MGLGSPTPLTTSGFHAPSFLHILWVGGVGKDLPVIPAPPSCPPSQCLGVPSGGGFYILCLLLEKEKREKRAGEKKKKRGQSASQLTTCRAFCFVGVSATWIPSSPTPTWDGSGIETSELGSPFYSQGEGSGRRPLIASKGSVLRHIPFSAAQGWAGLISWQWLLGSCFMALG